MPREHDTVLWCCANGDSSKEPSAPGVHLSYEGDEFCEFLGVFAGLQVENVQTSLVMTPLQREIISVSTRISFNASLAAQRQSVELRRLVALNLQGHQGRERRWPTVDTCSANRLAPDFAIKDDCDRTIKAQRKAQEPRRLWSVRTDSETSHQATTQRLSVSDLRFRWNCRLCEAYAR